MPPIIDKEKCIACGRCYEVCPHDVYYGTKEGEIPVVAYPEECWHEAACVEECPVEAIRLRTPLQMMISYKE